MRIKLIVILLNNYFNDPLKIIPYISHDLKELGFDDHAVFLFAKKVHLTFLEKGFRKFIPNIDNFILQFKNQIKNNLDEIIKKSHINAMTENLIPNWKIEEYSSLKYKIIELKNNIPLSDSAVLFHVDNPNRQYKPLFEKGDNLIAIILPITKNKVLIGYRYEYEFDFVNTKHAIIEASYEYFISSENNDELIEASNNIAKNAYLIDSQSIDNIINEVITDI